MASITTLTNLMPLLSFRAALNTNFTNLNSSKMELVAVPVSATAPGAIGQFSFDANYIYQCTATNTWVRAPLTFATW